MQPYDIFMAAVLAVTTFYGLRKGMAWQLASIASLAVSYVAALRFADVVVPYLDMQPPLNRFVAMLIVYLATSAAIWIAFQAISKLIERVQLKEFDRQVGALFGAAKGVLLCVVVTFFAVTLSNQGREMVLRSQSGHYIAWLLHEATPVMPPEVRQVLGPHLDRLKDQLDPRRSAPAAPPPSAYGFTNQGAQPPAAQDFRRQVDDSVRQGVQQGFQQAAEQAIHRSLDPFLQPPPTAAEPSIYQPMSGTSLLPSRGPTPPPRAF